MLGRQHVVGIRDLPSLSQIAGATEVASAWLLAQTKEQTYHNLDVLSSQNRRGSDFVDARMYRCETWVQVCLQSITFN